VAQRQLKNASFDAPSLGSAATFHGASRFDITVGQTGRFAMTARSSCGVKRKNGNEQYRLVYEPVACADATCPTEPVEPLMLDTADGNYHFTLSPGFSSCGEYTALLTLDGEQALSWSTTISAEPVNPNPNPNLLGFAALGAAKPHAPCVSPKSTPKLGRVGPGRAERRAAHTEDGFQN